MSFAGSLLLTGVGALVYKYDTNQIYEEHPRSKLRLKEYSQRIYRKEGEQINHRLACMFGGFFTNFFDGSPFLYPFKGMIEFYKHNKEYALSTLGLVTLYLAMFAIVSIAYWATITPVYTAIFAIFGPTGLLIAWMHAILHTNMLTMMFMRLCHFNNNLATIVFEQNAVDKEFNNKSIKFYVPIRTVYFWSFYLPIKIFKYTLGIICIAGLLLISSIPIMGPFSFNFLISPFITKTYVSKSLRLRGLDNLVRKDFFYEHFGQFTAFGFSCCLLENIPILSGFALCTNSIGAALWAIDNTLYELN